METPILIISGIVSLITLICFFVLCANVAKLKVKFYPNEDVIREELAKATFFGHEEKAKGLLEELIWKSIPDYRWASAEDKKSMIEQASVKWKDQIEKYSIKLPY